MAFFASVRSAVRLAFSSSSSDWRVSRSLVVNKAAVGIPMGKEISDLRVSRSLVVNKAAVGIPMGKEISDLRYRDHLWLTRLLWVYL